MSQDVVVVGRVESVREHIHTLIDTLKGFDKPFHAYDSISSITYDAQFTPQTLGGFTDDVLPMIRDHAQWIGFDAQRISNGEAWNRGIVYDGRINTLLYEIVVAWGHSSGISVARYIIRSTQPVVLQVICQPCLWDVEHDCLVSYCDESWLTDAAVQSLRDGRELDWQRDYSIFCTDAAMVPSLEDVYEIQTMLSQCTNWPPHMRLEAVPVGAVDLWDEKRHKAHTMGDLFDDYLSLFE